MTRGESAGEFSHAPTVCSRRLAPPRHSCRLPTPSFPPSAHPVIPAISPPVIPAVFSGNPGEGHGTPGSSHQRVADGKKTLDSRFRENDKWEADMTQEKERAWRRERYGHDPAVQVGRLAWCWIPGCTGMTQGEERGI